MRFGHWASNMEVERRVDNQNGIERKRGLTVADVPTLSNASQRRHCKPGKGPRGHYAEAAFDHKHWQHAHQHRGRSGRGRRNGRAHMMKKHIAPSNPGHRIASFVDVPTMGSE